MEINFFTIYLLGCIISSFEVIKTYRSQKFKDKCKDIQDRLYFITELQFDFIIVFAFLFSIFSSWIFIILKLLTKKE